VATRQIFQCHRQDDGCSKRSLYSSHCNARRKTELCHRHHCCLRRTHSRRRYVFLLHRFLVIQERPMARRVDHPPAHQSYRRDHVVRWARGCGDAGFAGGAIIELIGPSRVIRNAQGITNIDRSYEDATHRACLDNADTGTPLNAYGRECNE
jgi:hypothetical protein